MCNFWNYIRNYFFEEYVINCILKTILIVNRHLFLRKTLVKTSRLKMLNPLNIGCMLAWHLVPCLQLFFWNIRGGSTTTTTSKMELFVIIVNSFQPLTIITKRSILDVAAVPDPPLNIALTDNYPPNFIDSCIQSILNKLYTTKAIVQNVPKGNIFVESPFLKSTWFQIQKKLEKLFNDKLTSCNLKIIFVSPVRVKSFFTFNDKLPKDFFTSTSVVAAMLTIMVRPNAILKSKFVNI